MKKALILAIVFTALCFSCSEEDAVPVFIARKIVITSAEVTEWPKLSPDGSGWDIDSPDDDDQIGAYFLKFSDYLPASSTPKFSDYPTLINLTSQSGFKVKLSVTWEE